MLGLFQDIHFVNEAHLIIKWPAYVAEQHLRATMES